MSNRGGNSHVLAGALGALKKIGITLAEGLKGHPYIQGLALILVIVAIVTIVAFCFGITNALYCFIAVVLFIVFVLLKMFNRGVSIQKEQIRKLGEEKLDLETDTISIVNRLNQDQKRDILKILCAAATEVADKLNIPFDLVRSNLFGRINSGQMKMIKDFTFHMDREEEFTITMPVGYGSTGRCFKYRRTNIAIFREGWGRDTIEDQELRKVHPHLQWIISVPIITGNDESHAIWVMNVDGLKKRREEEKLKEISGYLLYYSDMISFIIKQSVESIGR